MVHKMHDNEMNLNILSPLFSGYLSAKNNGKAYFCVSVNVFCNLIILYIHLIMQKRALSHLNFQQF